MSPDELKFFNDIAPEWDSMEIYSTPEKINFILDKIKPMKGDKVLDLGAGTGILTPYLIERIEKGGRYHGIDASSGMLEIAKKKYGTLTDYPLFEIKDFELEDISDTYDLIFLYCVYPHLSNPFGTLHRLLYTNLKPTGKIIISFPVSEKIINKIHEDKEVSSLQLPSAEELTTIFRNHGFSAMTLESQQAYIVQITL